MAIKNRALSIFLPDYKMEGLGGAILSSRLSGINKNTAFFYFEDRMDPRMRRLRQVLDRSGHAFIREGALGNGYVTFLPPGVILSRRQWAAIGVPEHRLQNPQFLHDITSVSVLRKLQERALNDLDISLETITPRVVGSNRYGQDVYDGVLGRTLLQRGQWHAEWETTSSGNELQRKGDVRPESFLRGHTPESFRGCARAAAIMIASGRQFNGRSIDKLHRDILAHAPHLAENIGFRLIDFQEEIEAELASLVSPSAQRGVDPREFALKIDAKMAAHKERNGVRMRLQQYSTPFPISRIAYECVLPQSGDKLLEPTVGNGVLVSSFVGRDLSVTGIEMDTARSNRANTLFRQDGNRIITGDCLTSLKELDADFQLLVSNPPFENLERPLVVRDRLGSKMTLRRLDHLIAYESLQKLDAKEGRAFLVLPGDMITNGALDGARRFWDNYLRQTYHIAGSACVDGRLYRKMGTEFPVLLYAVGPMRDSPLSAAEIRDNEVESLPLLVSHDELYAWADETRANMLRLTGLSEVEPAFRLSNGLPKVESPPQTHAETDTSPSAPAPAPEDSRSAAGASQPTRRNGGGGRNPSSVGQNQQINSADEDIKTDVEPETVSPNQVSEIPASALTLIDDTEEDLFVRPYEAFSNVGEAQTRIQKSLQGLTYRALIDVQAKHGDIDEYVARNLGLKVSDLGERFSPEQIDASALAFARKEEGRGFLFADYMGVGKGREIAMQAMSAFKEGRPVIFWTEQPNLFTDFVARDLSDCYNRTPLEMKQSGMLKPYIFNQSQDAIIKDKNDAVLYRVGDNKSAKKDGLPPDSNLILSTYSQVQTAAGKWKVEAILNWATAHAKTGLAPVLILDEVHKAAGELSNTGEMIERLVDGVQSLGGFVTFSSATPLKSGKNIRIYKPVLPDTGMDTDALTNLIETNPLALQEVLSSEMARMGTMISREVDTSGVIRRFINLEELDPDKHAEITNAVDRTSAHLRELVDMAPEIDRAAGLLRSRFAGGGGGAAAKVSVQTTSPVSQFHTFSQYLMVAVKSAYDAELILDAIAAGRKPVVVVENTGRAILDRLAARIGEDLMIDGKAKRVVSRLPNIGDVLIENASKLLDIKITDPMGNETEIRLTEYEPWLEDFILSVQQSQLHLLTLDPIDKIKVLAQEHDLTVGEITKRSLEAEPLPDGRFAIVNRSIPDKREIVQDFNNGDVDIVVMNRSAATGISMHASPSVGVDLRPRRMIKLQLQSEITAETQVNGRTQRYGQVHDSEYDIPMSGYAADDRLCQLFNRKNRSLSATSTATRENRNNIDEAADLMNPVGEQSVRQYLNENPHISQQLGLPIPNQSDGNVEGYARKLMGRLVCLPIKTQEAVLSEIDGIFKMNIEALDARGLNPLRLNQHDWKATVVPVSTLIAGDDKSDSMGKRPLNLVRLTYNEAVQPLTFESVLDNVDRGQRLLVDDVLSRYQSPAEGVGELLDQKGEPLWSSPIFDRTMNRRSEDRSLGLEEISAEEASAIWNRRNYIDFAKASVNEKRVLRATGYAEFLNQQLPFLEPGNFVQLDARLFPSLTDTRIMMQMSKELDADISRVPALISKVTYKADDPLNLNGWKLDLAIPGETFTRSTTLSSPYGVLADMSDDERISAGLTTGPEWHRIPVMGLKGEFLGNHHRGVTTDPYTFTEIHRNHLTSLDVGEILSQSDPAPRTMSIRDDRFKEFIKFSFDDAPAGQVARERYALDGNMFQAVKISQGKTKLGEKAIYTTSSGEVRHGVILRSNGMKDVIGTLQASVAAMSVALDIKNEKALSNYLSVYQTMFDGVRQDYHYFHYGELSESLKNRLVPLISACLTGGLKVEGIESYVEENLTSIVNELRTRMESKSISEVFVGSDVFSEVGGDHARTTTTSHACTYKEGRQSIALKSHLSVSGIAPHASAIADNDAHLIFAENQAVLLFNKKSDYWASEGQSIKLLEQSTNNLGRGARLTKGVLGAKVSIDEIATPLFKLASDRNSSIMARGPVSNMQAVFRKHLSIAQTYILQNETELTQEFRHG